MSTKTTWALDPAHTEIGFKVKHMMVSNISGKFGEYQAKVVTDGSDFSNPTIEFSADVDSLSTGNTDRDGHLHSADFFDVAQFPNIKFKATAFNKIDSENYELIGDLTVRDITKSVKLPTEFGGLMKDPWGNIKAGFTIAGKINRKDFGLNWNAALETGGVLVSEDVRINAEVQLIKQ